jgi:hypothetical protein
MKVLLSKMGYNKNENLRFLNKRLCGMWLIWIGFIIILSIIVGGKYYLNPIIFGVGYSIGMLIIFRSKTIKKVFSYGLPSKFQIKMIRVSIMLMLLLIFLFSGRYFDTSDYRRIGLGVLLAIAIHFIPFSFVHGKLLLYLSIASIINILIGMLNLNISFYYLAIIDGILKIIFGVMLLMSKKPQEIIN